MNFLIADTFTDSLARLTAQEQKAAKTSAFDLQMDPSAPGLSFHKLDRAKDTNFWSVRVSGDVRLIVHRTPSSLLLTYVGHHDDAYKWAERRKIERHPTTGAMQLVEVRERVQEIPVLVAKPIEAPARSAKPKLFNNLRKVELMAFGVPEEWVDDVRAANEDTLFNVISHLPQEAQEALLKLAVGEKPEPPKPDPVEADPFAHPDALRRFRILGDVEALRRALEEPWEKWAVFLHPSQAALVARNFSGPARVSGSAGTGKTVVALHRAAHMARQNATCRVLLTTFSDALARALERKLKTLVSGEPEVAARIAVKAIGRVGSDLYADAFGPVCLVTPETVRALIGDATKQKGTKFSLPFLIGEWFDVIEPWLVQSKEDYIKVTRLGRKTRLSVSQRETLWPLFQDVHEAIAARGETTNANMFGRVTEAIASATKPPYDFAVIDEAQDLAVAEGRFLAAFGGGRPNALFFAGDLGQRIFQTPFSWKSLGLDIRGRSYTLRVNYRTSHQIRTQADRLLPFAIADVDGNEESRKGTVSVFNGPSPTVRAFKSAEAEEKAIGAWIAERIRDGPRPEEIGVFVRSEAELNRARAAAKFAGVPTTTLSADGEAARGHVAVSPMHLAKGLEFRAVAVMACDDEILPQQERIETVADDADLEEVYNTERHLLYVACTRARDRLIVSGVEPVSEFLADVGEVVRD
jgi:UvrD-like helicase C-terminal domain/AAA domain